MPIDFKGGKNFIQVGRDILGLQLIIVSEIGLGAGADTLRAKKAQHFRIELF